MYLSHHNESRMGCLLLESIGSLEDAQHQLAHAELLLHGTQFVSDSAFRSWLRTGCEFSPKQGTHPSELADLIAREVLEWVRSEGASEPKYWKILSRKWACFGDGSRGAFGLKVFPNNGMEACVSQHRIEVLELHKTKSATAPGDAAPAPAPGAH